jgi:hypothetical protein
VSGPLAELRAWLAEELVALAVRVSPAAAVEFWNQIASTISGEHETTTVYRCPVHGLTESPRKFRFPDVAEAEGMYCTANLSNDAHGIPDDVCHRRCEGPLTVVTGPR